MAVSRKPRAEAAPRPAATRPSIVLGTSEAERLSALALASEAAAPLAAGLLLDEIERARICADERGPAEGLRIGSRMEFVD